MKFKLDKIQAAKDQLDSAIMLRSRDEPIASTHGLAAAALQVTEDLCEHRGIAGFEALIDAMVKPEYQKFVRSTFRKPQNFFKHADTDPEDVIELDEAATDNFMLAAAINLENLGQEASNKQAAFKQWMVFLHPDLFEDAVAEIFGGAERLAEFSGMAAQLSREARLDLLRAMIYRFEGREDRAVAVIRDITKGIAGR